MLAIDSLMSEPYRVLLRDSPQIEICSVSREIARVLGRPLVDVTTLLRQSIGVIPTDLDEVVARRVADILNESGQFATVLPLSRCIDLPNATRIRRAVPEALELLVWLPREDEPIAVEWSQVQLMALGVIPYMPKSLVLTDDADFKKLLDPTFGDAPEVRATLKERVAHKVLGYGRSSSLLPSQIAADLPTDDTTEKLVLEYHLDLITSDPLFLLRISDQYFTFEGIERTSSSTRFNMHTLFTNIAAAACSARLSPAAARFLDDKLIEADLFADQRSFEAHTRWLLLRERIARP
jgi:hypothetical protein